MSVESFSVSGRLLPESKGPGLILVFWPIDRMERISLRMVAMDVPAQDVITKDNVSVKVNAIVYFRVIEPNSAVVSVENYLYATSQLSQTTLRSVLGQVELDDLLSKREELNDRLQSILDQHTDPWGIKVSLVEIKTVDLPAEMQRAMARQAEAERERRAKVIHAEGEFQAASRLQEAGSTLSEGAGVAAVALSLDAFGDRHRAELHHRIPHPHGPPVSPDQDGQERRDSKWR